MRKKFKVFRSSMLLTKQANIDVYRSFFMKLAEYHDVSLHVCVTTLLCSEVFITFATQNFVFRYGVDVAFKKYKSQVGQMKYNFPPSSFILEDALASARKIDELIEVAIDSPRESSVLNLVAYFREFFKNEGGDYLENYSPIHKRQT